MHIHRYIFTSIYICISIKINNYLTQHIRHYPKWVCHCCKFISASTMQWYAKVWDVRGKSRIMETKKDGAMQAKCSKDVAAAIFRTASTTSLTSAGACWDRLLQCKKFLPPCQTQTNTHTQKWLKIIFSHAYRSILCAAHLWI